MELIVYQVLEQVINVTEMTNKWMRWCEQSLPNQSVFVPSVFQMRDAYSHVIAMFAQGIQDQGLAEGVSESNVFDEVEFFKSDIVVNQFSEISEHTLRAYFDTADYIVESLSEICKNVDLNSDNDLYPLLRNILNEYDKEISNLRAKKSLPPSDAYQTVQRWDSLLQIITSAYSFSNYEYAIRDLYRSVYNTILDIEKNFEDDVIKEFDPNFYQDKVGLVSLKKLPSEYQEFTDREDEFLERILEDPVEWQDNIKNEFESIQNNLKERLDKYESLKEAMPSTALIRKSKGVQDLVKKVAFWLCSTLLSTLITTWVGEKMFLSGQVNIKQLDYVFLVKVCILFVVIEILFLGVWYIIRKIGFIMAKRKYQEKYM